MQKPKEYSYALRVIIANLYKGLGLQKEKIKRKKKKPRRFSVVEVHMSRKRIGGYN